MKTATVEEEPHGREREQAVRVMRPSILRSMSTGRTNARMHLFRSFLFLVEKICSFPSVSDASSQGYEIRMDSGGSEAELVIPEDICGTIWDVPKTVASGGKEELQKRNSTARGIELASRFRA